MSEHPKSASSLTPELGAQVRQEKSRGVFSTFNACMFRDHCRAAMTIAKGEYPDVDWLKQHDESGNSVDTDADSIDASQAKAVPDKGPWSVIAGADGKHCLLSDDFTYDVVLRIDGDFGNASVREEYVRQLAAKLNATSAESAPPAPTQQAIPPEFEGITPEFVEAFNKVDRPTLASLRGIAEGAYGGKSSEQHVNDVRNGDPGAAPTDADLIALIEPAVGIDSSDEAFVAYARLVLKCYGPDGNPEYAQQIIAQGDGDE